MTRESMKKLRETIEENEEEIRVLRENVLTLSKILYKFVDRVDDSLGYNGSIEAYDLFLSIDLDRRIMEKEQTT